MSDAPPTYLEPGGSWRPLWLAVGILAALGLCAALLPGPDLSLLAWFAVVVAVPGVAALGCVSARRAWTVRVVAGPDAAVTVGADRLPLADLDIDHLQAALDGSAGVDAGAPVLGGGWSVPAGRVGLPVRRSDGRTLLVPTRAPAQLADAIRTAHPAGGARPAGPGTVEP